VHAAQIIETKHCDKASATVKIIPDSSQYKLNAFCNTTGN